MSNVQVYSEMNANQLLAMMGGGQQQQDEVSNLLPLLKINYQEEDADGNDLKKGLFFLAGHGDSPVYAKEATIRVLGDFMQYLHYDADADEVVNRSIIHRMGDEPIDEKGTVRCGRPAGKDYHALSDDAKKKYQGITCFRYLYGTVSYEGETATGEKSSVTDVPCLFRTKGASFLNFSKEVVEGCSNKNISFQQVVSKLTTQRHKKGSVTYFTPHFAPDFANILELTEDDAETMRKILETIKVVNDDVRNKHDEALRNRQGDSQILEAVDVELADDELGF